MGPRPCGHVTTEELLAITGSTRNTLYEWVVRRLLPRPKVVTGPDGEQFAAWSLDAPKRVRYIVDRLGEGLAMGDIADGVTERWPRRP